MLACEGIINHLSLKYFPKRSTLSDANKRRSSEVFADIYYQLYGRYKQFLSDSRVKSIFHFIHQRFFITTREFPFNIGMKKHGNFKNGIEF